MRGHQKYDGIARLANFPVLSDIRDARFQHFAGSEL